MIWILLFSIVFLLFGGSGIYLAGRFRKFSLIRRIAGESRWKSRLLGLLAVLLLMVSGSVCIGFLNAVLVLIHLTGFWLICDGLSGILSICRGKAGKGVSRLSEQTIPEENVQRTEKTQPKEPQRETKAQPGKVYYAGWAALLLTTLYLGAGWYLAHDVSAARYSLETVKEVGTLRVLQFADSHIGTTFDGEGMASLVKRMNEEKPDVVLITGDFVDDDTAKEDMEASCKALSELETTYGVYYVYGNHDRGYYGEVRGYGSAELEQCLEENGVTVLKDEVVMPDDRFYIIGRRDASERGRASMEELTAGLDPEKYQIVADHQPVDYEAQAASQVDLVLSGHTHGGQMIPLNLIMDFLGFNDNLYGLEHREHTDFIVSSGISNWMLRFKTGCRSEYVVVDICGK